MEPDVLEKMEAAGMKKDDFYYSENTGSYHVEDSEHMLRIWMYLLNHIDPELNIRQGEEVPQLYG